MEYLRATSIILAVAGMVVYILLIVRHPKSRLYIVAPITWLLFTLSFLVVSYGQQKGYWILDVNTLNTWSAAVRIYSLIMVVGIGAIWLVNPKGELPHESN